MSRKRCPWRGPPQLFRLGRCIWVLDPFQCFSAKKTSTILRRCKQCRFLTYFWHESIVLLFFYVFLSALHFVGEEPGCGCFYPLFCCFEVQRIYLYAGKTSSKL